MMTFEGTTNGMDSRATGVLALGPSNNIQGGIRCFSLATGKVLHRLRSDCTLMKMPHEVLGRLKFINKREKSVKGLIFGDRNDEPDTDNDLTGLEETEEEFPDHVNAPGDLELEGNNENAVENKAASPETGSTEETETETADDSVAGTDNEGTGLQEDTTAPEHVDDETVGDPTESEDEESKDEDGEYVTRSGRRSRPYDFENEYPDIYGETNLASGVDELCLRPYFQDEELNTHLSKGITYSSGFFADGVVVTNLEKPSFDEKIERVEVDHYALYTEALEWFEFNLEECAGMVFKAQQMNVKQGIKEYGDDGKASALKEIDNLTSNECFGEIEYDRLTQTQKDRALPILMFMIMKRNGDIKTRGVANGSLQRVYTNKDDCS